MPGQPADPGQHINRADVQARFLASPGLEEAVGLVPSRPRLHGLILSVKTLDVDILVFGYPRISAVGQPWEPARSASFLGIVAARAMIPAQRTAGTTMA